MLPHIFRQALRANAPSGIVYLNNPKAGCTTIKFNLWSMISPEAVPVGRGMHDLEGSPFTNDLAALDWLGGARVFTFVRNPFVRVVSAYLNKIAGSGNDQLNAFRTRYRLDDEVPSFDVFLRLIAEDTPETLDPHWRPQHLNLMYPFVVPDAVGKLEEMDETLPGVLSRLFGREAGAPKVKAQHATHAARSYADYFGNPETLRRAISLYFYDFVYFGYSLDPAAPTAPRVSVQTSDRGHARLAALADLGRAGGGKQAGAVLERIRGLVAEDPATREDPFTRAWLLHSRIDAGPTPRQAAALVRRQLPAVLRGPEFLRRTALRAAAADGAWALCRQISLAAPQ